MLIRSVFITLLLSVASAGFAQSLRPGEWRTYTAMSNVTDMVFAADSSQIWVSTSGGIYRVPVSAVSNDQVFALRNSDGLRDNACTALGLADGGDVLVGDAGGGITFYHHSSGTFDIINDIASSVQYPQRQIDRLFVHDSLVFVATGFGLSIYDLRTRTFNVTVTRFGNLTPQDTVFDVTLLHDTIYVVLSDAIAYAPLSSPLLSAPFAWKTITAPSRVNLRTITSFRGSLILGSMQGLWRVSADTLAFVATQDSIAAIRLVTNAAADKLFALDARGNRLVSTTDLQQFTFEDIPHSGDQKIATAFVLTPSGAKLTGYASGGITVDAGASKTIGFSPDGPLSSDVTDLEFVQASRKLYALCGNNGITAFDASHSTWEIYPTNDAPLPRTTYTRIFFDSTRNTLWTGTFGDGLYELKFAPALSVVKRGVEAGLTTLYPPNVVIAQKVSLDNHGNLLVPLWGADGRSLAIGKDGSHFNTVQLNPPGGWRPYGFAVQDLDGYYFVSTQTWNQPSGFGISVVDPSTADSAVTLLLAGSGGILGSESVDAMVVDQDNGVWCGTSVGVQVVSHSRDFQTGALQFHARTLKFLDQQIVNAIGVDGVGNKWVGTQNGVFVVSPDGTDSLAHFTTANSPLIDNGVKAIAIDVANGEAYFATQKGISRTSSVFKQGEVDYSKISIYPNPIVQNGDDPVEVTVTGLRQGSSLLVLTPAGRRVATIDASRFGSAVKWDCRDENRKLLPTGVYLIGAVAPDAPEFGMTKFVLLRK